MIEVPHWGTSNEYLQQIFMEKKENSPSFFFFFFFFDLEYFNPVNTAKVMSSQSGKLLKVPGQALNSKLLTSSYCIYFNP